MLRNHVLNAMIVRLAVLFKEAWNKVSEVICTLYQEST
jgi:hypothetical protein